VSSSKTLTEEELKKIKEDKNPHVIIKLFPGRTEQQKVRLAEAIVKDVVNIIGGSEGSVSVAIEEIRQEDWREKVYKPDILDKWDRLYKKPGYSM
jgi:4-oxalocrotonate tautomerase